MAAFLRMHRQRAGMTLDALASSTGLTKSYLSKVERGLSVPSIAVALKIAEALDTDVSQLFSDRSDGASLTIERAADRVSVNDPTGPAMYDPVATRLVRKSMQPFVVHPTTDAESEFMEHPGEEFIHVQSGAVEVTIPGRVISLHEGDSLYFDSSTPHRVRSVSDPRAVVLVVVHDRGVEGAEAPDRRRARRCGPRR